MIRSQVLFSVALIASAFIARSHPAVIGFTGGNIVRLDASVETTNNFVTWDNVDYYEKDGFKLDFLPNAGSVGFATHVGNYYFAGNDVIHSHWATGKFGSVMTVEITKIGGGDV